jgi:hypothetical protein
MLLTTIEMYWVRLKAHSFCELVCRLFGKPKATGIVRAFSTLLDAARARPNHVIRTKFNKYEVVYNDC